MPRTRYGRIITWSNGAGLLEDDGAEDPRAAFTPCAKYSVRFDDLVGRVQLNQTVTFEVKDGRAVNVKAVARETR